MTEQRPDVQALTKEARTALGESNQTGVEAYVLSLIFQQHYLDPESVKQSPDNFSSCICGGWSEGSMEPGWDDHLAEVAIESGFRLSALSGETKNEWGFRVRSSGLIWVEKNEADARKYTEADPHIFELVCRKAGEWEVVV